MINIFFILIFIFLYLQLSRFLFYMSDEPFKLKDYIRNWLYLTCAVENHLAYYPEKLVKYVNLTNLPKNAMFKLTYNNLRLMVYFSFRSSFTQPGSHIDSYFETKYPWNRRYYVNYELDLDRDNYFQNVDFLSKTFFVNGYGYFRWCSFLFCDSQTFIVNNKFKWFIIYIITVVFTEIILPYSINFI